MKEKEGIKKEKKVKEWKEEKRKDEERRKKKEENEEKEKRGRINSSILRRTSHNKLFQSRKQAYWALGLRYLSLHLTRLESDNAAEWFPGLFPNVWTFIF